MSAPWQTVLWLVSEIALVVVILLAITGRVRSVIWQRTVWQAGLLTILGLLAVEFGSISQKRALMPEPPGVPRVEITAEQWKAQEMQLEWPTIEVLTNRAESLGPMTFTFDEPKPVQDMTLLSASLQTPDGALPVASTPLAVASPFPVLLAVLLGIWSVGSLVLAARLLLGRFLLWRFCARSSVISDEVMQERVQRIAQALGLTQAMRVLETRQIQTPVVFGLVRPSIALPPGFSGRFESRQQDAILAHELAHLAARDPLWYLLADILVSLLWWHPFLWALRNRLRTASEMAADEASTLAEHGPETLAECLVAIAANLHGRPSLESIGIEGSGLRTRLGQRVERLLNLEPASMQRPSGWRTLITRLGLPVVLVSTLLLTSGWVRKDQSPPWQGMIRDAWTSMAANMKADEVIIRRDPRPVLLAAAGDPVGMVGKPELNEPVKKKLEEIKLPELFMDGLPLGIALEYLNAESKRLDPEKKGLKMEWRGNVPYVAASDKKPLRNASGLPVIPPYAFEDSLNRPLEEVLVLINPVRKNLDFKQVIEAVCESALWPLQYEVVNDVVVFTAKPMSPLDAIRLSRTTFSRMPLAEVVRFLNETSVRQAGTNTLKFAVEGQFKLSRGGEADAGVTVIEREIPPDTTLRQTLNLICAGAAFPIEYLETPERVVFKPKTGAETLEAPVVINVSSARVKELRAKMTAIVIPKLQFKRVLLEDALTALEKQAKDADLEGNGLNLQVDPKLQRLLERQPMLVTVDPPMTNLILGDALEAVLVSARNNSELRLMHQFSENAVVVVGAPKSFGWQRVYRVDMGKWIEELESGTGSKLDPGWNANRTRLPSEHTMWMGKLGELVRDYLQVKRVLFSKSNEGMLLPMVTTFDRLGMVIVTGDLEQLEQVEELWGPQQLVAAGAEKRGQGKSGVDALVQDAKLLHELGRLDEAEAKLKDAIKRDPASTAAFYHLNRVQEARYSDLARKRDLEQRARLGERQNGHNPYVMPVPNPYVRTNAARPPSKQQQRILEKMDQIVIKEFHFDDLPLSEVVRYLQEESVKQDSEKKGINFIINPHLDDLSKTNAGSIDLNKVPIRVNPPLKNLSLKEALGVITNVTARVGKHGLTYMIEEYGIVIRQRVPEPPQLFTRLFKIDPEVFADGVRRVAANTLRNPGASTNVVDIFGELIRDAGISTNDASDHATLVAYNDKTGTLMARGTLRELEIVQNLVEVINIIPAQVEMTGQYVEMSREAAQALGFNLENVVMTRVTPAWIEETRLAVHIPTNKNVSFLGAAAPPRIRTLSGEEREKLLGRLNASSGHLYHRMEAGKQMTVDGRQAQVGLVADYATARFAVGPAGGRVENWASHMGGLPSFVARPKVYPDGETMRLDWVACLAQVLGHDNSPTRFKNPVMASDPVPNFRIRYSSSTTMIKSGETLLVECGLLEKDGRTWVALMLLTPTIVDPAGNPISKR